MNRNIKIVLIIFSFILLFVLSFLAFQAAVESNENETKLGNNDDQSRVNIENELIISEFSTIDKDDLLNKLIPGNHFNNGEAVSSENYKFNLKDSVEDYFINNNEKSLMLFVEGNHFDLYVGLFDKNGNLLTDSYDSNLIHSSQWKSGSINYYDCNGIKYILNISSHCPTGSCCSDSAKLFRVNNNKFEVVQEINYLNIEENSFSSLSPTVNAAAEPSFGLVMYPSEDKILIKTVPATSMDGCPQSDYKEIRWNKNACKLESI